MALKWFCDSTGKQVSLNPAYKHVKDKDGKPLTKKMRQQGPDGAVKLVDAPVLEYTEERGYLVKLTVGDESIQRVLSKEALDKMLPLLEAMMKTLENTTHA